MSEELEQFEHEVDLDQELADDEQLAEQEPEQQPAEPIEPELEPQAPPQFNYNDRLYALGFSGTGKSEYLNVIFSGIACQKLLIDTKPEFHIDDVEPAHQPEQLDWTAPILHYKPVPGTDCEQYEAIFERALTVSGPLLICVHEIQDLVDYKPQKAGRFLLGYLSKGGRLGKGFLGGTQRPRLVPTSAMTEANHILILPPQLARRDDMIAAAEQLSPVAGQTIQVADLERELALLEQEHGRYSALWKDRFSGRLMAMPPMPEHLRDFSIVQRLEDA